MGSQHLTAFYASHRYDELLRCYNQIMPPNEERALSMTNVPEFPTTIGINMDNELIVAALIYPDGTVKNIQAVETPHADGINAILQSIIVLCKRLLKQAQGKSVLGIGVSTIGLVHHTNGTILHADDTLSILQNVPMGDVLKTEFNLPVRVENNVNAMAIAELLLGAGRECDSFLYIHADNVLNGALVQSGRIWRGSHSSAGQIGQLVAGWMAEKPIQLANRASGAGIASDYNMRSRKFREIGINEIIQFSRHGDQLAIRVIRDGAHVLGSVLSPVVNLIDPERVVVGGLLTSIGDVWWKTFQVALLQHSLPALEQVQIVPAEIEEHAGMIGAGLLVHSTTAFSQK
jgi:glucokinase